MNPLPKIKIGLIGESKNDTESIANLLKRYFRDQYEIEWVKLVERLTGDKLKNPKFPGLVRADFQTKKPDYIIYIRDLDEDSNRKTRFDEFKRTQKAVQDVVPDFQLFFLLIQYALEALILADLATANRVWKTSLDLADEKPMEILNPQQWIKNRYNNYSEGSCPELFKSLRLEVMKSNHEGFNGFMGNLFFQNAS